MTKPEDIPQDVWDAAIQATGVPDDDNGWHLSDDVFEIVARAIMAAKAEEQKHWADRVAMLEQKLGLNGHEELQETFNLDRSKAKFLKALVENEFLSREAALFALTQGRAADPKIVDVQLCHLRKKIAPFGYRVKTIRGSGFQLIGPELLIGEAA